MPSPAMLRPATYVLALFASLLLTLPVAAQFSLDPKAGGFDFSDESFGTAPINDEELVTLSAQFSPAADGQPAMVSITALIAPGYHISSITQAKGGPKPTSIGLDPTAGVRRLGDWVPDAPPKTKIDQEIWIGLQLEEYYDKVTWRAPVELPAGADLSTLSVAGTVDMQACKNTCVPLDLPFTAALVAPGTIPPVAAIAANSGGTAAGSKSTSADQTTPPATEPTSAAALLPILGGAFLGGLILNLMPCVLPVIGLKVLSFAEQAGHDRGKVLAMNLAYTAGLMSVFLLLAALAAFAGYGWGELNTHSEYRIGMVVFVFAMALSFLGVWEIPLPGFAGGKGANDLQQQEGYSGAFFKGAFTTVLATPCSGPFLGPVFGYLITQPTATTFLVFAAIGLGMASPYLLIGAFPGLIKSLPKPGAWMETFKQLMGFVMMGTALYFLFWVVSPQNQRPLAVTLLAISVACWWIGRTPLTAAVSKRLTAWLGGTTMAVLIGWVAFTQLASSAPGTQLHGGGEHELAWSTFSPEALSEAKAEGKTVLIDFTASWCPTCQTNSVLAINTEKVKAVVESNGITPLLADWSDESDVIKQTLESLGSRSIPFLAIYPASQPNVPILLPDLITESQLLAALAKAGAVVGNEEADTMPTIEIGETLSDSNYR